MRMARSLADANAGNSIAARIEMMPMTTTSSISVNPAGRFIPSRFALFHGGSMPRKSRVRSRSLAKFCRCVASFQPAQGQCTASKSQYTASRI
jgi:hypothetical protein